MSQYYTGWIGLQLAGDREVARGYIREARKIVGAQRAINGIQDGGDEVFYKKVTVMPDKTMITVVHNHGVDNVLIHSPEKEGEVSVPDAEGYEFSNEVEHTFTEGGGETPLSVRPFEPEEEVKVVEEERFTYDKRVFCALGSDSVATSAPFHTKSSFMAGARMVDDASVFILENVPIYRLSSDPIPSAPPFNICTLDGGSMIKTNSIAQGGSHTYFDASADRNAVMFVTTVGTFSPQYTIHSIDMVTGGANTLSGFPSSGLPRVVPQLLPMMPGSDGAALFNEAPIQLLDPISLTTTTTTDHDQTIGSDVTYGTPWQSHCVANGAWAIWHHLTGTVEVKVLAGEGGFSVAAPISAVHAHMAFIAVMADLSTVWIYDGNADDLRVYSAGAWSGNMMPAAAVPNFVMLYDPVSDSIALAPSSYYVGGTCGPLAWIFDAKDCEDLPIETFSHDVSVAGEVPFHSTQFLDGAILTFTSVVAFEEVGDFLAADISTATYSKHVIGRLRQTKIEEYTRISESGARAQISKDEYTNAAI